MSGTSSSNEETDRVPNVMPKVSSTMKNKDDQEMKNENYQRRGRAQNNQQSHSKFMSDTRLGAIDKIILLKYNSERQGRDQFLVFKKTWKHTY